MISVDISSTLLLTTGNECIIVLKSNADEQALSISIGQLEAQAIAIHLNQIEFPRPLTHDLFKSCLLALNAPLIRVEIGSLRNDTFHAQIFLDDHGVTKHIDARPSDAIALALRFQVGIFIDDDVMKQAGVLYSPLRDAIVKSQTADIEMTPSVTGLEELQKQLASAIKDERYEEAARFRDAIKNLSVNN